MATMVQKDVIWEVADNFQKQTYRNRTYICTDRGNLMLNIPIKHVGKHEGRQKYKDIQIENEENWQRQHWRTLQTAYRTSPFFEYYEDDIAPLYTEQFDNLLEFNLKSVSIICDCLQVEMPITQTEKYTTTPDASDARFLVNAKKELTIDLPEYNQVFGDRHGFLKNRSVVDLVFNEGPSALTYLKNIDLDFPHA